MPEKDSLSSDGPLTLLFVSEFSDSLVSNFFPFNSFKVTKLFVLSVRTINVVQCQLYVYVRKLGD